MFLSGDVWGGCMKFLVFPCGAAIKVKALFAFFWLLFSSSLKRKTFQIPKYDLFFGTRTAGFYFVRCFFLEIHFLTGQVFLCKCICFSLLQLDWLFCIMWYIVALSFAEWKSRREHLFSCSLDTILTLCFTCFLLALDFTASLHMCVH